MKWYVSVVTCLCIAHHHFCQCDGLNCEKTYGWMGGRMVITDGRTNEPQTGVDRHTLGTHFILDSARHVLFILSTYPNAKHRSTSSCDSAPTIGRSVVNRDQNIGGSSCYNINIRSHTVKVIMASLHSVCWRFGVWDPDGFESCIQQRKTTCLLSIRISLASARASKLTTTNMYIARARWDCSWDYNVITSIVYVGCNESSMP